MKNIMKRRSFKRENQSKFSDKKSLLQKILPRLTYDNALPITAKKDEIIDRILDNQVVIISGETGSGKSTQIPKLCLSAGRGIAGRIGCTQPRRIAAAAVSRRIAEELGVDLGGLVGYKIRFRDKTSSDSVIKIMTDGILLAETQSDPYLYEYDTIIVDEAHERSLNIDFGLGILKNLLQRRKNFKLIVTSATIDTEKFSRFFNNAPVIEVSGRMYPVEERYYLPNNDLKEESEFSYIEKAVTALNELMKTSRYGDIILFMPTEQDIRETCKLIEGKNYDNTTVLPLYARLPALQQSMVFSRNFSRKIIVATNVAETSVTIPGIKYVIDTGLARISQYSPKSRTTFLPVVPVSRSSADQRKGRCGRVENGVCIRLFSKEDFNSRPLYTPPEILRANLAEVILRMISLNLGKISDFPFIDNPDAKSIRDGFDLLVELGAIVSESGGKKPKQKGKFSLTKKGRFMAKMPFDPRLSRILIEAKKKDCLDEAAIIVSALSIQDPRERPVEKIKEAYQMHMQFNDPSSDFMTFLNIWNSCYGKKEGVKKAGSLRKFCRINFLSFNRMREWRDIYTQVLAFLEEYGLYKKGENKKSFLPVFDATLNSVVRSGSYTLFYTAVHQSILSGFLSNIAVKKEKNLFKTAKEKDIMIFPGSALFNRSGKWIVAAEIVETSRLFARTAANIDSRWLEDLGGSQCKYTYLHPHWEKNRGEVVAFEQVSLYGIIIVSQRRVSYGKIDPDRASDIFIQKALVEGDIKKTFMFMKHNKRLVDEVKNMENKIRRRDILVEEERIFEFYKKSLFGIFNIRGLENKIKKMGCDDFLRMKKEDLLLYSPDGDELSFFPDNVLLGGRSFQSTYSFNPGKDDDGVTIKIPSALVSSIPAESFDWLVPGLLKEKIALLLKGLPKVYRQKLVPMAKVVDTIANEIPARKKNLITALGDFIYKRFGVDIPGSAWNLDRLPDYLKTRISITDSYGKELHSGREVSLLSREIHDNAEMDQFESAKARWEKREITRWDFGSLPDNITVNGKDKGRWIFFPGLEKDAEDKKSVNLRLFLQKNKAVKSHKEGVARLFSIHFSKELKFLKKILTLPKTMEKKSVHFGGSKLFEKRLHETVINNLFSRNIRSEDTFYSHARSSAPLILPCGRELLSKSIAIIEAYHETRSIIYNLETSRMTGSGFSIFFNEIRDELIKLVPERFMELYQTARLDSLVRYIKAIAVRAERASVNLEKDRAKAKDLKFFTEKLDKLLAGLSVPASKEKRIAVEEFFWLIEEYKVSIFAQELKTAFPVSRKRLADKLKEIERIV